MKKLLKISALLPLIVLSASFASKSKPNASKSKRNVSKSRSKKVNSFTYKPMIELTAKLGHSSKKEAKRHFGRIGFVVPVYQKMGNYMTFISMIALKDTAKHVEGNFGAGHRLFLNKHWILGGYGFYDARSTAHNNLLHQVTFGAELFSKVLEFRGNVYIPFGKKHYLGSGNVYEINHSAQRNTTIFTKSKKDINEIGMGGFDVEAGGTVGKFKSLEGFVAFYYFNEKNTQSVKGVRIRANYALTNWLSVNGETNLDKKVGHTSYLGVKLSWDLNGSKGSKYYNSLKRKMTKLPVRDIDIVTGLQSNNKTKLYQDEMDGELGFIFDSLGEYDEVDSNVVYVVGQEDLNAAVLDANRKISNIGFVKAAQNYYVGADDVNKRAGAHELFQHNIADFDVAGIDVDHAHADFRKTVAALKVAAGTMTAGDTVVSRLMRPREAIDAGWLTLREAAAYGLQAGIRPRVLLHRDLIPRWLLNELRLAQDADNSISQAALQAFITDNQNVSTSLVDESCSRSGVELVSHMFGSLTHRLNAHDLITMRDEILDALDHYLNTEGPIDIEDEHESLRPNFSTVYTRTEIMAFQRYVIRRVITEAFDVNDLARDNCRTGGINGGLRGIAQDIETATLYAAVFRALRPNTANPNDPLNARRNPDWTNLSLAQFWTAAYITGTDNQDFGRQRDDYVPNDHQFFYGHTCSHGEQERVIKAYSNFLPIVEPNGRTRHLVQVLSLPGLEYVREQITTNVRNSIGRYNEPQNQELYTFLNTLLDEMDEVDLNSLNTVEQARARGARMDEVVNSVRNSGQFLSFNGNIVNVPNSQLTKWDSYYNNIENFIRNNNTFELHSSLNGNRNIIFGDPNYYARVRVEYPFYLT
jgi:hypothetical protein